MISWIQRSFQNHFRIIFGVLLAVTIISFIMVIGAAPGIGDGERKEAKRDFFGRNIASQAELNALRRDAGVSIELQVGSNPFNEEKTENYGEQRIAALWLADQLHLPTPSVDSPEMTAFIRQLRIFSGADGQFDPATYARFKASWGAAGADIGRILVENLRIDKVQALLAGPGYVLPADIRRELLRSDTSWTVATGEVDYASFHPNITPTDAQLTKYYQDNNFRFQIGARAVSTYIDFPASRYLPNVRLTEAEVRAFYDQNPERFPKPVDPKAPAKAAPKVDPNADYAAVRGQVEAAAKLERAKADAAKDASDFAYLLYQKKIPSGAALDAFLASRHVEQKPLAPFTEEAGPAELGSSSEIAQAVFQLSADRYFSEAIGTPDGAVVLLWKSTLPPRQPLLTEVKEKVKSDYIDTERRRLFAEFGMKLKAQITASLKSGDTFEKAVAAAAKSDNVKIAAKTWPAFTLRDRPKDLSETTLAALEHLNQGEVSDLAVSADKGYLVYAVAKKSPDLSEASPQYAKTRAQLAAYLSHLSAGEYLNQLVSREKSRTEKGNF